MKERDIGKLPHWKQLIEYGLMRNYFDTSRPEEYEAYNALKRDNPDGYRELFKFDRRQALRDLVYQRRSTRYNGGILVDDEHIVRWEYLDGLELPEVCLRVASLLLDGWLQVEIAEKLSLSPTRINEYVRIIRDRVRGKESGRGV